MSGATPSPSWHEPPGGGPPPDAPLAGRRVLLVEDEMLVLMVAEDMLADLGCRAVSAVATVPAALALLADQRFDLALLDMNLAGATTDAVADALAARGVPFAFVTGYSGRHRREVDRHRPLLRKPYHAAAMAAAVTGLLTP